MTAKHESSVCHEHQGRGKRRLQCEEFWVSIETCELADLYVGLPSFENFFQLFDEEGLGALSRDFSVDGRMGTKVADNSRRRQVLRRASIGDQRCLGAEHVFAVGFCAVRHVQLKIGKMNEDRS